jgi:4-amino-4-deoxy-L-arabinose transferase-like glycosyltransferase
MPVLFNLSDPLGDPGNANVQRRWYQPALLYSIALTLRVFPLTEAAVRAPTAIVGGLLDPVLMYLLARRLFRRRWLAVAAAAMLVLSPPHLILSRQALDYVLPVPIVLAWLLCLVTYLEGGGDRLPAACGLLLGLGVFTYIGSWIFMPLCLLLTCMAFWLGRGGVRAAASAAVAFMVPIAALIVWLASHPDVLRQTAGRYDLAAVAQTSAVPSAKSTVGLSTLGSRISEYWDYFDPGFLFLTGGPSMTTSTGRAGVLLLPLLVFLSVGLYEVAQRRQVSTPIAMVLLAGFALAPVPATLAGERYMVQRELVFVVFAALIATCGVAACRQVPRRGVRAMTVLLLAAMPVQFAFIYRDYFTHYKLRSAFYYDPVNFRDVAEYVIAADATRAVPRVYFSNELDDAGAKWRFYVTKQHREEMLRRTVYFMPDAIPTGEAPRDSLLAMYPTTGVDALVRTGDWSQVAAISDIDHRLSAVICRKIR